MTEYVNGLPEEYIKKMDSLRKENPFIEEIIKNLSHNLFSIQIQPVDPLIMQDKCQDHGSEGPEAFDQQYYYLMGGQLHEMYYPDPSLTVKNALVQIGHDPEALIKVRHQKIEIKGEHHHDIELTIYKYI